MKTQLIKSERKLIIFGDVVIICDLESLLLLLNKNIGKKNLIKHKND